MGPQVFMAWLSTWTTLPFAHISSVLLPLIDGLFLTLFNDSVSTTEDILGRTLIRNGGQVRI
jgi:hypothetical protein